MRRRVTPLFTGLLLGAGLVGDPSRSLAQEAAFAGYRVQVLTAPDSAAAAAQASRLDRLLSGRFPVYIEATRSLHKVQIGDFPTIQSARPALAQVRDLGYSDAWILREAKSTSQARGQPRRIGTPPATDPATPAYAGFHDQANCRSTFGWAWASEQPDAPVRIDIYDGETYLATVEADLLREDLLKLGKGNGRHGFSYVFPVELEDGGTHSISARFSGTDVPVAGTPRRVTCPPTGHANSPDEAAETGGGKQIRAARIEGLPPRVDGSLDDRVWQNAQYASDFLQRGPDGGYPPAERTQVAFLYDDEALYVGARMYSASPFHVRALGSRRDDPANSERIIVSLDTYHDRRTAYSFGVTAAGVRIDYYHPRDSEASRDYAFDPIWEARAAVDSSGWTAEMRIPFSQLRFSDGTSPVWGVNVNRWEPTRRLNVYWAVVPLNETGWASRFGELLGIDTITPAERLQLVPYVAGQGTFAERDAANPFNDQGSEMRGRIGGDLKWRIGSNLTLDATVNPDFGQVEADPAVVNLTAFETSFPERRPFFIEGSQLLQGDGPNYFYSRRVGAPPHGTSAGDFVDQPLNTTILGAAKVTGRLQSGLSVGALAALTDSERARTFDEASGSFASVPVEPLTGFGIVRLQQQFGPSASTAGLILTGVRRDLSRETSLEGLLSRQAYAGGGDWNLRFAGGMYELSGYAGFSAVEGDSTAILRLQRSSARYFQRPDADYVSLDASRTSLSGYTGSVRIAKNAGRHWLWEASGTVRSPGFEINDAGGMASADDIDAFAQLRYRSTRAGSLFKNYELALYANSGWNFGGVRQFTSPTLFASAMWQNFWRTYLQVGVDTRARSDDLTRGGPLMGTGAGWSASTGIAGSGASKNQWSLDATYSNDELGGWSHSLGGGFSLRPGSRMELSLYPGYARANEARQFFTSREGGGQATFGRRYVFSFIDRSTLYTQLRLKYAFTPDLNLELYAEPFASSGRFHDFGELRAPGSRELRLYGTDGTTVDRAEDGSLLVTDGAEGFRLENADFNVRSFRSNLVLRWDWRRGSTLYLIWQENRFAFDNRGDLVRPAALWDSLGDSADDILAAKVTYWLPID